MKYRFSDILTVVLFGVFIVGMMVMIIVLPGEDFSQKEKRYLAEAPQLTAESLLSGEFGEQAEEYAADHVPGRDWFVMLSAYYDLLSGRQVTKDIYVASGNRLVEAPLTMNRDNIERNMAAVNSFAEKAGRPVDLMIVPSAGYMHRDSIAGLSNPYIDDRIISEIYSLAGDNITAIDLLPAFVSAAGEGELYYRTDHHWTSLGAYTACREYVSLHGRDLPEKSSYTVESVPGFCGSTYSRSGLWLCPSENVELWRSENRLTAVNGESDTPHEGVFYEERLAEPDKYTVYLDGNHSTVTVTNADAVGKGSLLVIRDSYANCLGAFLADAYETVTLVDLRYYRKPVTELLADGSYDDVLVCYSLSNFMTDSNIPLLR